MATERERQLLRLLESLTPEAYADLYQNAVQSQAGQMPVLEGPIIAGGFDPLLSPDALAATEELYSVWRSGYAPEEAARMLSTAIANKDFTIDPADQEKIFAAFARDVESTQKATPTDATPYGAFKAMDMPELAMLAPALKKMQEQKKMQTIGPSANTLAFLEDLQRKAQAEIDQSQQEINAYKSGEKKRPKGVMENILGSTLRVAAPVVAGLGTAGAVMASPFTGGATLAAVPLLAGITAGTIASGGASAGTNALLDWAYGGKDREWAEKKIAPELADIAREEERLRYVKQMAAQQGGIAREAQKVFDKRFADFLARQGGAPQSPFDVERAALIRSISG